VLEAECDEFGFGCGEVVLEVGDALGHGDEVVARDGVICVDGLEVFDEVLLPR